MSDQEVTFKPVQGDIHWRAAMGKEFIGAWDCAEDKTVTITNVEIATLPGIAGKIKAGSKPVLSFQGTTKKLIVNATIGETIASLYGTKILGWKGKRITLYATTDRGQGGKQVECVRVRPRTPVGKNTGVPKVPVDEAMRERQRQAMEPEREAAFDAKTRGFIDGIVDADQRRMRDDAGIDDDGAEAALGADDGP